jgi:hypothetical protein
MVSTAQVRRAVQVTARVSALLFAAAQATSALGARTGRAPRRLYLAFMTAHAIHFIAVAWYAKLNRGRDLFPGGRSMREVGGWPTVVGIFAFFSGLAVTASVSGAPRMTDRPGLRAAGQAATWLMSAMFASVYLGQLPRSRWYAMPAAGLAGAVSANVVTRRLRRLSAERAAT